MKAFQLVSFLGILFVYHTVFAAVQPAQALRQTLIVGASVSYGYEPISGGIQPDPITILATRYHEQQGIMKHAIPGVTSLQSLATVPSADLDRATSAVGIDLFFWDSFLKGAECTAAVNRVQSTWQMIGAKNIPWILGRVPNMGFPQPCMIALNNKIDALCSKDTNCRLIDFQKIESVVKSEGGLTLYGKFYTASEIQPDGLHLSAIASQWVADLLDAAFLGQANAYLIYGHR